MGKLSSNRAQIVAGGLISASFVSDLYDIFTGAITESVQLTGSMKITGSMIVTQGITASLQGTSSWSNRAITASYVSLVAGPNIIINTVGTNYEITGSPFTYNVDSASFAARITANSSSIALLSGSFLTNSSSFAANIIINSASIATLSGSFLNVSASFSSSIAANSSSIAANRTSYLIDSASFSASLALNTVNYPLDSASFSTRITGLQSFSSSIATPNSTLKINGLFTGSLSGSLNGTASYATNAENAQIQLDATNANRFIIFTNNSTGPNNLKADTGFEYNPNTNTLSVPNISATAVVSNLTGNVTGNIVGTTAVFTSITGSINGTTSGIHNGNVQGNVSGSITGSLGQFLTITSSLANINTLTTITGSFTQITASFITASLTGTLTGTASFATTASHAVTASYFAMPVARFSNSTNNVSLTNSVDNNIQFNTTDYNTSISNFELSDSGLPTATIFIKQPGYYEFISQVYLSGLGADVDILVKLATSSTLLGAYSLVSLFNDYKSVEGTNDQTVTGTLIEYIAIPGYYRVLINPSNANITLITSNSTPSKLTVKKLG